mgnify:CR=1 FL=1|jgi:hypothetical protein
MDQIPLLVAASRDETNDQNEFLTHCGRPRSVDD